jgi:hypothetical protein
MEPDYKNMFENIDGVDLDVSEAYNNDMTVESGFMERP